MINVQPHLHLREKDVEAISIEVIRPWPMVIVSRRDEQRIQVINPLLDFIGDATYPSTAHSNTK